jgi:hypothetical protein
MSDPPKRDVEHMLTEFRQQREILDHAIASLCSLACSRGQTADNEGHHLHSTTKQPPRYALVAARRAAASTPKAKFVFIMFSNP